MNRSEKKRMEKAKAKKREGKRAVRKVGCPFSILLKVEHVDHFFSSA
jgi:hypothetical protein